MQVMALWGEGGEGGGCGSQGGRMFARVRRFYRPEETPLAALCSLGGQRQRPQLFRTDHIDDRLPLAQAARKCSVALLPGGAPPAAAEAAEGYVCAAQLDHQLMTLGALPPDCAAAGGGAL